MKRVFFFVVLMLGVALLGAASASVSAQGATPTPFPTLFVPTFTPFPSPTPRVCPPITPTPGGWWDFVCSSCVTPTSFFTPTPYRYGFYGDSCLTHVTTSFSRSASEYGHLFTIYKTNFSPFCANRPDHLYLLAYFVGDAAGNQLQVDVSFDSFWQRYYFNSFPIILQYDNVGYGQNVEVYSDLIPNSGGGWYQGFVCLAVDPQYCGTSTPGPTPTPGATATPSGDICTDWQSPSIDSFFIIEDERECLYIPQVLLDAASTVLDQQAPGEIGICFVKVSFRDVGVPGLLFISAQALVSTYFVIWLFSLFWRK